MKLPEDQIRYIDLPDVSETFVDSFGTMTFDGQTARIELCVTRMDVPTNPNNPPKKPTAKKYPACRLVLTPDALLDLSNNLQNIINALMKEGVIKPIQPETKGTTH
jgi:hypothetical protein